MPEKEQNNDQIYWDYFCDNYYNQILGARWCEALTEGITPENEAMCYRHMEEAINQILMSLEQDIARAAIEETGLKDKLASLHEIAEPEREALETTQIEFDRVTKLKSALIAFQTEAASVKGILARHQANPELVNELLNRYQTALAFTKKETESGMYKKSKDRQSKIDLAIHKLNELK